MSKSGQFSGEPLMGYASKGDAVRSMYENGMDYVEIAQATGLSRDVVRAHVYVRGMKPRPGYARMVLGPAAKARRMSVSELENLLLETIARENLVDAILDDRLEAAE